MLEGGEEEVSKEPIRIDGKMIVRNSVAKLN